MTSDAQLRVRCPCGELIIADDEQSLVDAVNHHLDELHPDVAGRYTPEEILFLASF
jgi:hypothetical protein